MDTKTGAAIFMQAILAVILCLTAPANAQQDAPNIVISGVSSDPTYGYSPDNPIPLGGFPGSRKPNWPLVGEIRQIYFGLLRGSEGEIVTAKRIGACCPFNAENAPLGKGLVDRYLVTPRGRRPVLLFVNHYKPGALKAPMGFVAYRSVQELRTINNASKILKDGGAKDLKATSKALLKSLLPAANNGSPISLMLVPTHLFHLGQLQESNAYLLAGAEAGVARNQFDIFSLTHAGKIQGFTTQQALRWLHEAARNKFPKARRVLGFLYAKGSGVIKDPIEAARLNRLAAEQGNPIAQLDYGMAWILGLGVPKNPKRGLMWLVLADRAKDKVAARLLKNIADHGLSEDDLNNARAAADAWADATQPSEYLYELRFRSLEGDPLAIADYVAALSGPAYGKPDLAEAYKFAMISRRLGVPVSESIEQRLRRALKPEQRERVEREARAWQPVVER